MGVLSFVAAFILAAFLDLNESAGRCPGNISEEECDSHCHGIPSGQLGEDVGLIGTESMIKDEFNKNNLIIWHDGMRSMMGKCFKVVQGIYENEVGLPSPNGEDSGVWLFPLSTLCKCEARCNAQKDGCCTQADPCDAGQGACNADNECSGLLTCGDNRKCEGTLFRYKILWFETDYPERNAKDFVFGHMFNSATYENKDYNLCDSNFEDKDADEVCQYKFGTNHASWGSSAIPTNLKATANRAIKRDWSETVCQKDDYVWVVCDLDNWRGYADTWIGR